MDALYPFLNFLQPGILWPALADAKPMMIAGLVALLAGMGRRRSESLAISLRQPAFLWLCAFVAVQTLSVHAGGLMEMFFELVFWITFVYFVVVSVMLVNSVPALQRYVWGTIAGTMVVVFYGIYAVYAELPEAVGGRAGAYGMYENHNDYSFAIIMILPFILFTRRNAKGRLARLSLLACALACIAGIFLSLSRGGVLALSAELALYLAYGVRRHRALLFVLLALASAAAIGWQWRARAINQGDTYTAEDAEISREELWRAGWAMFKSNPLLGVGSRRFGEYSTSYAEISHDNLGKNAHNTYFELAATSGLLGFVSFALMLRGMHRELSARACESAVAELVNLRTATRIALYSIMLRALLDAKSWDWSFYLLCAIALASGALLREAASAAAANSDQPALPAGPAGATPR
jgi:O-antigen ligase